VLIYRFNGETRHARGNRTLNHHLKQGLFLSLFSATSIVAAFFFQWFVLGTLGAGAETDAFFASFTVPQLILTMVSSSLMHVLVPVLAIQPEEKISQDAWTIFFVVFMLFSALTTMLFLLARFWVPVMFPGFKGPTLKLAIKLTRIQLFALVLSAVNAVQWASYHARQKFVWAEFVPMVSALTSLVLLVWSLPRFGILAAAWLSLFRLVMQTILLLPGMGTPRMPRFDTPIIRQTWKRLVPLLAGTTYYKTDPLVERMLLSMAPSGNLSLYYFAQQIYGAFCQVLNKAIAAPTVPQISNLYSKKALSPLKRLYFSRLTIVCSLGLVALLIVALFGKHLLMLFVVMGKFSPDNVVELWWILVTLGGFLLGGLLGQISSVAFYACGDTKTPTKISMVTYTIYIPCKVAGFFYWKTTGLALVTSVYYLANFLLQFYVFRRRYLTNEQSDS